MSAAGIVQRTRRILSTTIFMVGEAGEVGAVVVGGLPVGRLPDAVAVQVVGARVAVGAEGARQPYRCSSSHRGSRSRPS